jgi:hypothetical protein
MMMNKPLQLIKPADYYTVDLLSNSGLSKFEAKIYDLPGFNVNPATLRKGSLTHLATYQQEEFFKESEAIDFLLHKSPSNDTLVREVLRLSEVARNTPMVQYFLKNAATIYEQDFYCLINGIPFKVKPDAMLQIRAGFINDLKTTACRTREEFLSKFEEYKYWRQAWLYLKGTGCANFSFLGVSKTRPGTTFLVDVKNHKKEMKEAGEEALELLDMYVKLHPNYISNSLKLFVQ